jgi:hypothetical protein
MFDLYSCPITFIIYWHIYKEIKQMFIECLENRMITPPAKLLSPRSSKISTTYVLQSNLPPRNGLSNMYLKNICTRIVMICPVYPLFLALFMFHCPALEYVGHYQEFKEEMQSN